MEAHCSFRFWEEDGVYHGNESLAPWEVLTVPPPSLHLGNYYQATCETSVPVSVTLQTLNERECRL